MYTNLATTLFTNPSGVLNFHKLINPQLFYFSQVINHAHAVLRSVSFVYFHNFYTGEIFAITTKAKLR
jgi:hypothetical protein